MTTLFFFFFFLAPLKKYTLHTINPTNFKYKFNDLNKFIELNNNHYNSVLECFHHPEVSFIEVYSSFLLPLLDLENH